MTLKAIRPLRVSGSVRDDRARGRLVVLNVASPLGHSSPAITQHIYQHVRRDRLAAAAHAISDALGG